MLLARLWPWLGHLLPAVSIAGCFLCAGVTRAQAIKKPEPAKKDPAKELARLENESKRARTMLRAEENQLYHANEGIKGLTMWGRKWLQDAQLTSAVEAQRQVNYEKWRRATRIVGRLPSVSRGTGSGSGTVSGGGTVSFAFEFEVERDPALGAIAAELTIANEDNREVVARAQFAEWEKQIGQDFEKFQKRLEDYELFRQERLTNIKKLKPHVAKLQAEIRRAKKRGRGAAQEARPAK